MDASKEYVKGSNQNALTEDGIHTICKIYSERSEVEKLSKKVHISEIENNQFDLNIPRYIDNSEAEIQIDMDNITTNLNTLSIQEKQLRDEISKYCSNLGIKAPFNI